VSTTGDVGEIIKISSDGTQTTFATIPSDHDLRGIVFDEQGNLFVAGHGSNDIYKVTPNGTVSVVATGLAVPQFLAVQPSFPPASPSASTPPYPAPPPHPEP
jgi:DNA-binding beta-propeller fold protein YncE